MFRLTRYTPTMTSVTALSAVVLAGFGFDHLGEAARVFSHQSSSDDFLDVIELSNLNGTEGFKLNGVAYSLSGASVASAGDVNGDGFADVIIGARNTNSNGNAHSGQSYVVFGKQDGFGTIELSSLEGTEGFKLNGAVAYGYSGVSVASAGDVNGDGFSDVIVGAWQADPNGRNSGQSYVVFGKQDGFGTIELSSLEGTEGFKLNGAAAHDYSGIRVASAGDVNADGFSDVIIGAYGASPNGVSSGQSYVIFGKDSGFGTVELSSLDGMEGFKLNGVAADDLSGNAVAGAGDVNADGFADMIIGAYFADSNGNIDSGQSYVVFGKDSGFGTVELSSLDGVEGFKLNGVAADDLSGRSVANAGDVNGDGFSDVIIGAFFADVNGHTNAGQSYVYFGKGSGFGTVELSSLNGAEGFKLNGVAAYDYSGTSVSGVGDMNLDGYGDVIIGASDADVNGHTNAGQSYVYFGKSSDFGTVELSNLNDMEGLKLNGVATDDQSGICVASAGDVNRDGFADVIVGAYYAQPNGNVNAGQSYVIFGAPSMPPPTPTPPTPTPVPLYPDSVNVGNLNAETGSILTGGNNRALMGVSLSQAGDLNIDGMDDVIVGASGTIVNGVFNAGAGYVVFGDRDGFPVNASVTKLTGKNGFTLVGAINEMGFATSVGGIGDVDQDGIDDVIIGSPYGVGASSIQTGKAYVVYGRRDSISQTVNVTQLDGKNGFALAGEFYSDQLGTVVSGAGDVNRDGCSDFMVSAPYASVGGERQAGKVYMVFGDYRGSPSVLNVTALNGTNGFSITGENAFDRIGGSLSAIGDINGDGIDDIAIGAPEALADGKVQAGKVYVIFGHREGFSNVTQLSSLNGENGFSLNGAQPFDNFGASVSWSKVNDDRLGDIIVGAPNAQNSDGLSSGRVYVFYGKSGEYLPQYNISLITPESGFVLDGEQVSDRAGASVSGIGDFNVDGLQDILIGAPQATANGQPRAGKGYVVFGQRGDYPSTIALSSLDGNNGFTIEGEKFGDNLGLSVSGAGDMNQDGAPDILVGAPGEDNGGTGYTALVYGGVSLFSDARQGQSLRAQNNNTANQALTAANDVASVVAEVPAFV